MELGHWQCTLPHIYLNFCPYGCVTLKLSSQISLLLSWMIQNKCTSIQISDERTLIILYFSVVCFQLDAELKVTMGTYQHSPQWCSAWAGAKKSSPCACTSVRAYVCTILYPPVYYLSNYYICVLNICSYTNKWIDVLYIYCDSQSTAYRLVSIHINKNCFYFSKIFPFKY